MMHVALIAPLYETVPPAKYGGVERVVAYLVEELVSLGHAVTLYGAGGSKSSATLVESWPTSFRQFPPTDDNDSIVYKEQCRQALMNASDFDVMHIHHGTLPIHIELFTEPGPYIWTDHGLPAIEGKPEILKTIHFAAGVSLISISDSQRPPNFETPWLATIHHGIPANLLKPLPKNDDQEYIAFLGRIAPDKGVGHAVRIATSAGLKLKVAAKLDAIFEEYFESEIRPIFDAADTEFIGEIAENEKSEFLSNATALIFPIQWEEPFGLVMIEAMACGTPVIAFNRGSTTEIIDNGVTGFIVSSEEEAVTKIPACRSLNRAEIRNVFLRRFTAKLMAERHVAAYEEVIKQFKGLNTD